MSIGSSEKGGRLVVLGSCHFFADPYLEKEDNDRLRDAIFRFLTTDQVHLNAVDAEDPDVRFRAANSLLLVQFFHVQINV